MVKEQMTPEGFIRVKIAEFKTALRSIPDLPPDTVRFIHDYLDEKYMKQDAEFVLGLMCDYYKVPRPKIMTYTEARDYVRNGGPGWEAVRDELVYDTLAFINTTYRGQIDGADAIILKDELLDESMKDLLPEALLHEFYHWLFSLASPSLPPPLLEAWSRKMYNIEQKLVSIRVENIFTLAGRYLQG